MWPCVKIAVSSRRGDQLADGLVHRLRVEHAARVDHHEPVVGVDHGGVGERVDEGDAGLHLGQLPARRERVVRLDGQLAREQLVGEVEHVEVFGHGGSLARRRRPGRLAAEMERVSILR